MNVGRAKAVTRFKIRPVKTVYLRIHLDLVIFAGSEVAESFFIPELVCQNGFLSFAGIQFLGVFSIDPLFVTEMAINQGGDSPVSINLSFKNETIRGFGNMKIESVT